jgi:hypothetical protein
MQYGYKNAEFYADFESVEKVAKKTHSKKVISEKVTEKWNFLNGIELSIKF